MDIGFSEQQELLRRNVRDYLAGEAPMSHVRAMIDDEKGYSPEIWKSMAELGLMGIYLPEEYGGNGGSFLDLAVVMEEIGRSLLPGPYMSTVVLGAYPVLLAGSDAQKQDILTKVADGGLIMTMALTEADARYEASSIQTTARQEGDSWVLNGTKLFVPEARVADLMVVVARTGGQGAEGITLFLVDGKAAGVSTTPLKTIDFKKLAEVKLENVKVPADRVLGPVGQGWPIVKQTLLWATAATCMEQAGGAQKALEMTVEYAKTRVQFGQPIGAFQAVKHKCANMLVDTEGAKSLAYWAAKSVNDDAPDAEQAVAMAKAWCSDAYRRVSADAIQVHGGIGFTWEHDIHFYFRKAAATEQAYGDATFHREAVAATL